MTRYYYYQGFGAMTEPQPPAPPSDTGLEVTTKPPFYLSPNPVGAFLVALQKSLGVPQTGAWDKATHDAFWGWIMAREALTSPGGVSDMPSVLPWKPLVCASDGFPLGSARVQSAVAKATTTMDAAGAVTPACPEGTTRQGGGKMCPSCWYCSDAAGVQGCPPGYSMGSQSTVLGSSPSCVAEVAVTPVEPPVPPTPPAPPALPGEPPPTVPECVNTAWLIVESFEAFVADNPPFVTMLGWPSLEAMRADPGWEAAKNAFGIDLVRHMQARLAGPAVPLPPMPPVPPPVIVVRTAPSTSKATVGWILVGVTAAGLLFWGLMRKSKASPTPEG